MEALQDPFEALDRLARPSHSAVESRPLRLVQCGQHAASRLLVRRHVGLESL